MLFQEVAITESLSERDQAEMVASYLFFKNKTVTDSMVWQPFLVC